MWAFNSTFLPKIAELSFAQIGSRFDGDSCFPTGLSHGLE